MSEPILKQREISCSHHSLQTVVDIAEGIIAANPKMTLEFFEFEVCYEYGNEYVALTYSTPETAEETAQRKAYEALYATNREASDRQLYETLKKRFETN